MIADAVIVTYLESIDVAEPILDMTINDELRQTQYLTTQVKRVAETRLLSLLHQSDNYSMYNLQLPSGQTSTSSATNQHLHSTLRCNSRHSS